MIARGFKPVGWVAAIGAAALGCYMLSLQVAAERAELARLENRIVRTRQAIRSLQTELGTRGRLQQLEQWNAEVLALSAPVAGQFLESNVSLARFDVRQPSFSDQAAEVRVASAEPAPAPAPVRAPVRLASAPTPVVEAPIAEVAGRPLVRRASLTVAPSAAPVATQAAAPAASPPAARPRGAATRPAGLLDESTLRDLSAESRTERAGGTRN
jgi:hypothetical protein